MSYRNGQAALEFMMTYGWAILVVLAAIGALSYFGVLNPAKFTPDTCLASSGFACPGKPIISLNTTGVGNVSITLVNGVGYPVIFSTNVTLTNWTTTLPCNNNMFVNSTGGNGGGASATVFLDNIAFCPAGNVTCGFASTRTVQDGEGMTLNIYNCSLGNVQIVKGQLTLSYINPQSSIIEKMIVSVTGKPKSK